MDKWKRGRNGVLINDDAAGYDNARKRVALKAQRRSELEELKERIGRLESSLQNFGAGTALVEELTGIKDRLSKLERGLESTDKTIQMLVELCKTLYKALKAM